MESMESPTLDDVLDWFAIERQEGISFLADWQKRYPQYATELAEFYEFLHRCEWVDNEF